MKVRQLLALADEPCDGSNILWYFAREFFADFNLDGLDSFVVSDGEEGRVARRNATFVVQRLHVGGVQLDAAGIVAADHGEGPKAGARHGYIPDARALFLGEVGEGRAARDELLQLALCVHDPGEAERVQRCHVDACWQVERPVGQAQAAERGAAEDVAVRVGVQVHVALVEVRRGAAGRAKGAERVVGGLIVPELDIELLDAGGGDGGDPLVEQVVWRAEGLEAEGSDGRVGALADDRAGHRVVEADPEIVDGAAPAAGLGVDKVDNGDAFVYSAPPPG